MKHWVGDANFEDVQSAVVRLDAVAESSTDTKNRC